MQLLRGVRVCQKKMNGFMFLLFLPAAPLQRKKRNLRRALQKGLACGDGKLAMQVLLFLLNCTYLISY